MIIYQREAPTRVFILPISVQDQGFKAGDNLGRKKRVADLCCVQVQRGDLRMAVPCLGYRLYMTQMYVNILRTQGNS